MNVKLLDLIDEVQDLLAFAFRVNQDQDCLSLAGREYVGFTRIGGPNDEPPRTDEKRTGEVIFLTGGGLTVHG